MLLWTKSWFSPTQIVTPVNFKETNCVIIIVATVGLNNAVVFILFIFCVIKVYQQLKNISPQIC